jgi:putative ABC transport system permease protein
LLQSLKKEAMLRNYFKIAFRNLSKNKFYTWINILGLAFGLATCLLILLYVIDEHNFDRYNENGKRIYRVNNEVKFGNNHLDLAVADAAMGPALAREFPQVEQYTRLQQYGSFLVKKGNQDLRETKVAFADSSLFEVFTLPMISGDPKTALRDPHSLVITERMANKYFGRSDVTGENLLINDKDNYKITGVIRDIPEQSHFNFDFFVPMTENESSRSDNWLSENFNTYILLKKDADPKKLEPEFNKMMNRYVAPELKSILNLSIGDLEKGGGFVRCSLIPLEDIHLHSNKIGELGANGNIQFIYIFSAIALLILLIACVNFMNLSTARASSRAKEVGVRKVLGSLRKNLVQQFITESVLMSFMALTVAIMLAMLLLPFFNQLAGKHIQNYLLFQPRMILSFVLLMFVVGILAGSYPAFYLSSFQPIKVLKGKVSGGFKGSALRNVLVVFQFSISVMLIVGTIVIFNQLNFIRNRDIGYNRNHILILHGTDILKDRTGSFKNELLQVSGVVNATVTGFLPVNGYRSKNTLFPSASLDPKSGISMEQWNIDENYIPTLGIRLSEGRNYSKQFSTDSSGIIINEAAAEFLGIKDLLNKPLYRVDDIKTKKITEFHIIGIIKNFNFNSLHEVVSPLALVLQKESGSMAIRVSTTDIYPLIAQIRNKWQSMVPGQLFDYSFMDDEFNELYATEQRTGQLFITFAVLAILIGCLGLFGLVTYSAEQRTKEIGIRKVLGASVGNITGMLSKDFLKLVVISWLIAFPIAWYAMNKWLQDFAYRVSISWWVFASAGIFALIIALLTISSKAIKAAVANPAKSLKSE